MRKLFGLLLTLLISISALAHDEGHGPNLTDSPKKGGIVAPVILESDAHLGAHAKVVHKAELVRGEDGAIKVYLYDDTMNALSVSDVDANADAIVEVIKKKKVTKTPFKLTLEGKTLVGFAPKPSSKPFNLDVHFKKAGKALLVAFDNLD